MNTNGNLRDYEGIINSEDIKLILDRYHIGKKPLAKLLGWGETTIIRYIEGDIPSSEYSKKLQMILDEPVYYYELLMERKDSLTGVAFRKSRRAVLSWIMSSKIYAVSYYIVNKFNAEISANYIQYLLYYIQAFALAFLGREIFPENYIVDESQKPYPKIYRSLTRNGMRTIEVDDYQLSEEEMAIIDSVCDSFSWYGPRALKAFYDYEKTYLKVTKNDYDKDIISKDTLKRYFRDVLYQFSIHEVDEIYKYPDRLIGILTNK